MPAIGVRLGGQQMTWEEAFHEAATNPLREWPYTADMLALMAGVESEEPDDAAFSPSRLLSCHRQSVLKGQTDYYLDADLSWPLVRGNMVHALMERARYPGALETIRETRFTTELQTARGPVNFTAKPDLIVVERIEMGRSATFGSEEYGRFTMQLQNRLHVKIVDYKSKGKIEHSLIEAQPEHELQVNMYALIVARELPRHLNMPDDEVVIDELEIDYVDMARVRRFTSAGWLTDRGKRLSTKPLAYETLHLAPITLWPLEKVARFVIRRIEERIAAHETLPPCSYVGTEKEYLCNYCPVRESCVARTKEEVGL